MSGTTRRRASPRAIIAGSGALPWLICHVLFYAVLLVTGSVLAQLVGDTFRPAGDNMVLGLVGALLVAYVLVPLTVIVLALLRLGKDLRWYWFRLVALVLLNLPGLLTLDSGAPWVLPAVQSALALLVVQPRWELND